MTARNKPAAARGARIRQRVRDILIERAHRCPLGRPLKGKEVRARLEAEGVRLSLSATAWHIAAVRREDERHALEAGGESGG